MMRPQARIIRESALKHLEVWHTLISLNGCVAGRQANASAYLHVHGLLWKRCGLKRTDLVVAERGRLLSYVQRKCQRAGGCRHLCAFSVRCHESKVYCATWQEREVRPYLTGPSCCLT